MQLNDPLAIRVAGSGGQGNILTGKVLAQAAMLEKKYVVQTQSYGAQVRGGISHCDVIICDEWIDFPEASQFDIMYIMHIDALRAYQKLIRANGIILIDSTFVDSVPFTVQRLTKKILMIPLEKLAVEKFNATVVSNMIGLGALIKATKIVGLESLIKAIQDMISERYVSMNIEAIKYGYEIISKEFKIRSERKIRTIGFE
ncbi:MULTISPECIES: 2-oxoacid:acceptor oxidoreductase family protein [Pseudothermotoga]|uniref:Pyruvate ferredoxin/flavodoxin oxidoreductase n=1 Tax=Pseudothermotoga lettingae (strain ATCC BAA-301 / DSM 14385 / NBRC 107922 / TMO) TaxID=416591 RepID=A8F581_PSELT|nr:MULTISPECIES: 2-oxoacid:acceptor oxidoreductase family protein [Pseudothermotoga]ABV33315.1 pyruvate ferredoxin/flavodoxin oxidoreductase [Pseudothermotoga lettingae TMO]KUK21334.1 MAG: Pyruvate ferredoxin/flavodoxin oxidoreductase [Pseudothermotoga lettingae]MDI3493961.1 2-oxoglutarate ferredoxin oxidoreductase subunit gamma [Pseudothermotoga sp.]MDK2884513.1 2-oxoglutarate ferredoxin oxidoreductase subunit gamma [Pseudothermotoga sp.]GLI49768.1 oxoacid ferredoxin oxidoreductase subunit ga